MQRVCVCACAEREKEEEKQNMYVSLSLSHYPMIGLIVVFIIIEENDMQKTRPLCFHLDRNDML